MGKRATEPAPKGLVTSDAVQAGVKLRKRLIIGIVTLIVLAGLGTGGWYFTQTSSYKRVSPTVKTPALSPAEAITAAQAKLNVAQSPQDKSHAYTELGQAYMSNNQPEQAVDSYQQALGEASGSSEGSVDGSAPTEDQIKVLADLADAYAFTGQISKEVAALQQVAAYLEKSSNPDDRALAARYEKLIAQLQGMES